MSERKIKHWGKNAGEAFGRTGYKGMKGEHWFADYFSKKGYLVELYESSREAQLMGIDVLITSRDGSALSVDVKNNLKNNNSFYVEVQNDGWLFNSKYRNEYVSHVNVHTGIIAMYTRKQMQNYILEHCVGCKDEIVLLRKETPGLEFIRWTFTHKET